MRETDWNSIFHDQFTDNLPLRHSSQILFVFVFKYAISRHVMPGFPKCKEINNDNLFLFIFHSFITSFFLLPSFFLFFLYERLLDSRWVPGHLFKTVPLLNCLLPPLSLSRHFLLLYHHRLIPFGVSPTDNQSFKSIKKKKRKLIVLLLQSDSSNSTCTQIHAVPVAVATASSSFTRVNLTHKHACPTQGPYKGFLSLWRISYLQSNSAFKKSVSFDQH